MEDPVNPFERLQRCMSSFVDNFQNLLPYDPLERDYDAAVRRAEDALVAAEAENEVHEAAEVMSWYGWAVPAILEVMAEEFPGDWAQRCEEIAPKIADRIACDPQRAIAALTHDTMSR